MVIHTHSELRANLPLEDDGAGLPAIPVSQHPVSKFREFLDLKKLKVTGERMKIIEHVFERHNHFEADQLLQSMRDRGMRVSRPTVYRTLSLLVEAGLLRELRFGRRSAYEHNYGYPSHEHLYCEKCGNVVEFVSEELNRLQDEICQKNGFQAEQRQFIIYGTCSACRQKRQTNRKYDLI
ncbi:transcriptional repressor [bacterium]|nr:transcriptional repressor [bacterium]